jgi:hypothetical protein
VCRPTETPMRTPHATHTHDNRTRIRSPPDRSSACRTTEAGTRPYVPLHRASPATCEPTHADTADNPTSGTAGSTRKPSSWMPPCRPRRHFGNAAAGAAVLASRLPSAATGQARRGSLPSVQPFT